MCKFHYITFFYLMYITNLNTLTKYLTNNYFIFIIFNIFHKKNFSKIKKQTKMNYNKTNKNILNKIIKCYEPD